jgi:transcriptional antiterminator RfaH
MTNLPRFALSAKAQELMQLAPDLVSQFREVPILNHEPPEAFEGLTWFVVVCNPKCERRAQLGLRRAGYQTYLPQTKRWVVHARKKEARENPLFPRYLFVGLRGYGQDNGQDTYRMDGVQGVESIVRNESRRPVQIPPRLLARLLERELAGEFDFTRLPETGPEYRPGEMVRLSKGALAGMVAEVSAMLSKGRVEVLVNFMGNVTRAKMAAAEVQRLEAAE